MKFKLTPATIVLCALACSTTAIAQSKDRSEKLADLEEVMVSASRIQRSGFETPTPVTSIDIGEIFDRGSTNIADYLNELPEFAPTGTPSSSSLLSVANGANTLNLRGLGAGRTLLLVNGRRTINGNMNVIPAGIIGRVDVVTGGASAAWGSDAIAGVVNLVFDKSFEGLRADVQYGVSGEGDADNTKGSFAFGSDVAGGRGHFILAGEYENSEGVNSLLDRDWSARYPGVLANPANTGPNDGIPARIHAENVGSLIASEGGHTLGPFFVKFGPGGTVSPFQLGSLISGSQMVGGDAGHFDNNLVVPFSRKNLISAFDYELTDNINFFFEGSYSESNSKVKTIQSWAIGQVIFADNPYIPAEIQTILGANNIPAFGLYRINTDLGFITADTDNATFRSVLGLDGTLGSDWTWEAYYQYEESKLDNRQLNNLIVRNLNYAADAVAHPVTGQPVCRATLTGGAPGCVPINLFGNGSPSPEAAAYVTGTEFIHAETKLNVFAASMQGDVFDNWAGPVSVAFGAEYRETKVDQQSDDLSQQDAFLILNTKPLSGKVDVTEAFAEVLMPLLADAPGAKALDFNGAVRYTDYSSSGSVTTWKGGLTYRPNDSLLLRGTRSRDIRAPTIGELFSPGGLTFFNSIDPFTGLTRLTRVVTGGNPNLRPEEADTTTLGFSWQPEWIENFGLSVDWYEIDMSGAVGAVGPQTIIDNCFNGQTEFCSSIIRDASGAIFEIRRGPFNVDKQLVSGIDLEARYGFDVDRLFSGAPGDISVRVLTSYLDTLESTTLSPTGEISTDAAGDLTNGLPKLRGHADIAYNNGPFTLFTRIRYVDSGKFNNNFTAEDIDDNSIPERWYVNLSSRYLFDMGGKSVEVFGGINNLFDKDPPAIPIDFLQPVANIGVHHDLIGRYFYMGVRVRM